MVSFHPRPRTLLVAILALVGIVGCRPNKENPTPEVDEDRSFAEDGTDASSAESDAQLLTSTLVSSSATGLGLASVEVAPGGVAPRDLGDAASGLFFPKRCLAVTPEGPGKATYTFNGCAGPSGLLDITGALHVQYEAGNDAGKAWLRLQLDSDGLSINGAVADWNAAAEITTDGSTRTMHWTATLEGKTAGGRDFERKNDHNVTWMLGEACFTIEGYSEGTIGKKEIRTEIDNFRRCRRACPDAGGKITVINLTRGKRIEIRYDGTNRATFVDPKGRETSVRLLCRP